MLFALVRLFRGPSAQDRVLALDTFYINGMLMLLMLGIRYGSTVYFDMALLIALFGFVGTIGAREIPAARRGDRAMTRESTALGRAAGRAAARSAAGCSR